MHIDRPQSRCGEPASRLGRWAPLVILAILVFAVFANSISNGFVFDDTSMIQNNRAIRTPKHIGLYFTRPFFSVGRPTTGPVVYDYYRPMVLMSYLADYFAWGLDPRGWHLSNIALHAAASLLVFLLLDRLKLGRRASFTAAAVFAVHPALADSVAGVSGRSDPLCAVFFLSSMILYLGARRGKSVRSAALLSASCLAFALALLTKENAIALPFVLIAYEATRPDGAPRRFRTTVPFYLIAAGYLLWRSQVVPASLSFTGDAVELARRIMTAADVVAGYALIMFFPRGLGFETFTPMVESVADLGALASSLAVLALAAAALFRKISARIAFFILWFFACMIPFLYFFLFHPETEFFTPPHFLYFPSIGLAAISGFAVADLAERRSRKEGRRRDRAVMAAATLILVMFCAQTARRSTLWRDNLTFFSEMVKFAPRSPRVHIGLAGSLMKKGRPGHALATYARALELARAESRNRIKTNGLPPDADKAGAMGWLKISDEYAAASLAGMGDAYAAIGEIDNSIQSYKDARSENAFDVTIHVRLARACERKGRFDEAIESYERAARLGLRGTNSYVQIVRRKKELFERAKSVHEAAVRLDRGDSAAALHSEALMARLSGETLLASALLREALRKDPTHFGANIALGRILSGNGESEAALGNFGAAFAEEPTSAIAAYELAVTNLILRDTLAAEQWAAKAYDLSPEPGYLDLLEGVRGIKESGRAED